MAVKPYIPRTGDVTDEIVGATDTEDDVMARAEAAGTDVDGAVGDYRDALRHLTSHSVDFHGIRLPWLNKKPKRYGKWRCVPGSEDIPLDTAARHCQRELQAEGVLT